MVVPSDIPAYIIPYQPVELDFSCSAMAETMANHWEIPLVAVVVYVVVVFGLKQVMESRKGFNLKWPLAAWNLFLAVGSMLAFVRIAPYLWRMVNEDGVAVTVCGRRPLDDYCSGPAGLWATLFTWSKIAEMVDTLFIVLRRKPLMFLHWYHHVTVLLYTWLAYTYGVTNGYLFGMMNVFVHSWMYSYYFFSSFGIKIIPPIFVTIIQILQMFLGLGVVILTEYHQRQSDASGGECYNDSFVQQMAFFMYGSYLILFLNFFVNRFIRPMFSSAKKTGKSSEQKKKE